MQTLENALFVFGLIFPIISWVTFILCGIVWWRDKKHCSPVLIPFIGPVSLSIWVLLTQKPYWLIPITWIADIGTIWFLSVCPILILDWWRTSSFTRLLTLEGTNDDQSAILSLHSSGVYLLKKTWKPDNVAGGIVALSETGTYSPSPNGYELVADHGLQRYLKKTDTGAYSVEESISATGEQTVHSLHGWSFTTNQA